MAAKMPTGFWSHAAPRLKVAQQANNTKYNLSVNTQLQQVTSEPVSMPLPGPQQGSSQTESIVNSNLIELASRLPVGICT